MEHEMKKRHPQSSEAHDPDVMDARTKDMHDIRSKRASRLPTMPLDAPNATALGVTRAQISRLATSADGGINLTLSIPANETDLVKKLLDVKIQNRQMLVVFTLSPNKDILDSLP